MADGEEGDAGDEPGSDGGGDGSDAGAPGDGADPSVHDPGETGATPPPGATDVAPPADREFGRQGWLLVAAIVVAFLVIPATIYLNAVGVLALPFRVAFLALPMIPAVALAVLAVWVTATE